MDTETTVQLGAFLAVCGTMALRVSLPAAPAANARTLQALWIKTQRVIPIS